MEITTRLMDLDAEVFRLQAELVRKPDADGTRRLEELLNARQELLLKMESEERERVAKGNYKGGRG
jgi:hypothetical protein